MHSGHRRRLCNRRKPSSRRNCFRSGLGAGNEDQARRPRRLGGQQDAAARDEGRGRRDHNAYRAGRRELPGPLRTKLAKVHANRAAFAKAIWDVDTGAQTGDGGEAGVEGRTGQAGEDSHPARRPASVAHGGHPRTADEREDRWARSSAPAAGANPFQANAIINQHRDIPRVRRVVGQGRWSWSAPKASVPAPLQG